MTNDIVHFNVYCTTMKHQQSSWYSKTVLYNDNSIVNTSITGLLPNTTYTCCVLTITSYGESEPVCQNITAKSTIFNAKSKYMMYIIMYCSFTLCLLLNFYLMIIFVICLLCR